MTSPEIVTAHAPFIDRFEELENYLPDNMTIAWGRGTQSFWEVTYRPEEKSTVHLFAHEYAERGEQLPEDSYNEGMEVAQVLSDTAHSVHYVRYDHIDHSQETAMNAPYRYVEGHSWHKVPQSEIDVNYIEVEGKLYFKGDL